jgi:hemolysin activation/secretion protein
VHLGRAAWSLLVAALPCHAETGIKLSPAHEIVRLAQASPSAAPAPAPAPGSPKFEIRRYLVEGNTLLSTEALEKLLAPFTGKDRDFGDVQRALEALQASYQAVGYGSVEIRLPEQELERGEVKFIVIEAKIARITVEGNENFSSANIRRSVPSLREGETPNSTRIAESIRLANENPAKQSAVVLRGTEREDRIDAVIRVADVSPERWSVSLDNTGNQNTGRGRLGIAYQNANLRDRDEVVTLQYITSPTKIEEVMVWGLGYRLPLYSVGDSIEMVAGYSNVDSGTVQDLFLVAGQGTIFGLRYNQALPKWRDLDHKLIYGLDYRAYQNQVTPEGDPTNLVPDITVHPFSLTYSASLRGAGQDLGFYLSLAQNIPGGNDGQDEDFKQLGARFNVGSAGYRLFRGGFNYLRAFKDDWQFRANWSGQYTDDALVAGEQFGIGGADSVRGFNERYVSNDKGYRTTVEFYSPDQAKRWGLEGGRLRFLAFYDTGAVRRNYTEPHEQEAANLDSGGFGLRWSHKSNFTARLDAAYVFHDGSGYNEPDNRKSIWKAHFSMSWVW